MPGLLELNRLHDTTAPSRENCGMKSISLAVSIFVCSTFVHAQASGAGSSSHTSGPLTTIASLDVQRYMGTWYEIAKYPNWFQRKCISETKAEYQLKGQGGVQVINRCRREYGGMDEAIGEARQIGPSTSSKLKVRFAPSWLSLLPFAVAEPKREYLWVLSRNPKVEPGVYHALLAH